MSLIGSVLIREVMAYDVEGIGNILIKMFEDIVQTFGNMKHVSKLKISFIYLSSLDLNGHIESVRVSTRYLMITNISLKVINLYVLDSSTILVNYDVSLSSLSMMNSDITK